MSDGDNVASLRGRLPETRRHLPAARVALLGLLAVSCVVWSVGQVAGGRSPVAALGLWIPSPVVGLLLAAAGAASWSRSRRGAALLLVAALVPLWVVLRIEHRWIAPRTPSDDAVTPTIRMVSAAPTSDWVEVVRASVAFGADLVVLSGLPVDPAAVATVAGAGYSAIRQGEVMALAKGRLAPQPTPEGLGRVHHVRWQSRSGMLDLLLVDLPFGATGPGAEWTARFHGLLAQHLPDVVAGDFDCLPRSPLLTNLPTGLRDAYEAGGTGWSHGSPGWLPLWTLDHVLVGPRVVDVRFGMQRWSGAASRVQTAALRVRTESP